MSIILEQCSECRRSTMKSTESTNHGSVGVGNGWRRWSSLVSGCLVQAHVVHEQTYCLTLWLIQDHQNCWETKNWVLVSKKPPMGGKSGQSCNILSRMYRCCQEKEPSWATEQWVGMAPLSGSFLARGSSMKPFWMAERRLSWVVP